MNSLIIKNSIKIAVLSTIAVMQNMFAQPDSSQSLILTKRQQCDLELILNGGFAPLTGFMCKSDYNSVVKSMHLSNGSLWPIPVVLDVDKQLIEKKPEQLMLKSEDGTVLAIMDVEEVWQPNKQTEVEMVYGTKKLEHPGVKYILHETKDFYVGGTVTKVAMPKHYDFCDLRKTPEQLKQYFKEKNITNVVAFQTRNPMHRAHQELTFRASQQVDAHLLIHPVVGLTKPGDVDHFTRVRCYKQLIQHYPENTATLSLLPLAMRMAGPREALWHALIRKNYGCTHFIVGRDHAGPGSDSNGTPFYGPYEAQKLALMYAHKLGVTILPFNEMVYVPGINGYKQVNEVNPDTKTMSISGTQLRTLLHDGKDIPSWFTYPEVAEELRNTYPPRNKQGFTIFFTGLSGSGKSTIANALALKLMEIQNRPVSLLDGDEVRKHLSSELGFSREHRSLNIRRIGFVAHEITKNGGVALCAAIAPYDQDRLYDRNLITQHGGFIEVFVATPLDVCEQRDVKGMYKLAREGKIKEFTGISDPYETPTTSEIVIDTSTTSIEKALDTIINYLKKENYII